MKKHYLKIRELIKHNKSAFRSIISLISLFAILTAILNFLLHFSTRTTPFQVIVNPFYFQYKGLSGFGVLDIVMLIMTLFTTTIVSAFSYGGLFSYLEKGKQKSKKMYYKTFFSDGQKNWRRMIGAILTQKVTFAVYFVVAMTLISIPASYIQSNINAETVFFKTLFGSYTGIVLIVGMILLIIIVFTAIIFTIFIPYEALFERDLGVKGWIKNSFLKGKKVFWKLFLGIIIIIAVHTLITDIPITQFVSTGQISILIDKIITGYVYYYAFFMLIAHMFYPLYKDANDRLKGEKN